MVLHYSTRKMGRILTSLRLIRKYYSNDYDRLTNRLSELRAANNLSEISELPPPRRHKLNGEYKYCWGIDYSKNDRIVVKPEGEFCIDDLATITEIEIVTLGDYH